MTHKNPLTDCFAESLAIVLIYLAILAALAVGYIKDYPETFYQPGAQIIDEIEMNDAQPEHGEWCGYHVNSKDEQKHIEWMLRQAEGDK